MAYSGEAADVGGLPQGDLLLGGGTLANTHTFLKGLPVTNRRKRRNNRSVMPLDVSGCTRATMNGVNEFLLGLAARLIFAILFVTGIDHCNYWSSTRNF